MGLRILSSCSTAPATPVQVVVGNPDPKLFTCKHHEKHGRFLIVEVIYTGCTTFEGKKLLVYEGVSWNKINHALELDPHFCDDPKHLSPVARFVPTVKGWNFARAFCKSIP